MSRPWWSSGVRLAPRDGQEVNYWVTPIYQSGNRIPDKIRLTARGSRGKALPPISIDKCLINREMSENRVVRDGSFCGP